MQAEVDKTNVKGIQFLEGPWGLPEEDHDNTKAHFRDSFMCSLDHDIVLIEEVSLF